MAEVIYNSLHIYERCKHEENEKIFVITGWSLIYI